MRFIGRTPFKIYLFFLCAFLFNPLAHADQLTAVVDRTEVSLDETFNLMIRFEGDTDAQEPDFSVLSEFEILSNNVSRSHSVVNNQSTSAVEWHLLLAPKTAGEILIPPLSTQGLHSQPITLKVSQANTQKSLGGQPILLENTASKNSVYIQEQFILTYRLYYAQSVESLDAKPLNLQSAEVIELPRVDYQKTLDGTAYNVAEFRYAVLPSQAGQLEIPSQTWTVAVREGGRRQSFFDTGRYKNYRLRTEALSIQIKPKPSQYPAGYAWLPSTRVSLSEQWSQPPDMFKQGEPITRTLTLDALGVMPEVLSPMLDTQETPQFKIYPDQPKQDKRTTREGLLATRTESAAIIPNHAGQTLLPEIKIPWWNTDKDQLEYATLPSRTLNVKSTTQVATTPNTKPTADLNTADLNIEPTNLQPVIPTAENHTALSVWALLLGITQLLTLLILGWLLVRRPRGSAQPVKTATTLAYLNNKQALSAVYQACKQADAQGLRQHLLALAQHHSPHQTPSLLNLSQALKIPELSAELIKLDTYLFSDSPDAPNFSIMADSLKKHFNSAESASSASPLPALYPDNKAISTA